MREQAAPANYPALSFTQRCLFKKSISDTIHVAELPRASDVRGSRLLATFFSRTSGWFKRGHFAGNDPNGSPPGVASFLRPLYGYRLLAIGTSLRRVPALRPRVQEIA
jgi:hypothetical protein